MGLLIDHSPMGAAKQDQRNAGLRDTVQLSDAGLGHGAAIEATNTAKIAYFVKVSEICERNRSPFFGESDIHLAGRPSGRSGLMIKDPPNVDAIGGSAVMARLPEFYNLT